MKGFYIFMSLMALIIVAGFLMFISNKLTTPTENTALTMPYPETSTYVERERQTMVPVTVPQAPARPAASDSATPPPAAEAENTPAQPAEATETQ